jgi:hypothetical protein
MLYLACFTGQHLAAADSFFAGTGGAPVLKLAVCRSGVFILCVHSWRHFHLIGARVPEAKRHPTFRLTKRSGTSPF